MRRENVMRPRIAIGFAACPQPQEILSACPYKFSVQFDF